MIWNFYEVRNWIIYFFTFYILVSISHFYCFPSQSWLHAHCSGFQHVIWLLPCFLVFLLFFCFLLPKFLSDYSVSVACLRLFFFFTVNNPLTNENCKWAYRWAPYNLVWWPFSHPLQQLTLLTHLPCFEICTSGLLSPWTLFSTSINIFSSFPLLSE